MWAETDDLAPVSSERGFSFVQYGLGARYSLTSYGRETPMISRRSADDLGSLQLSISVRVASSLARPFTRFPAFDREGKLSNRF